MSPFLCHTSLVLQVRPKAGTFAEARSDCFFANPEEDLLTSFDFDVV